MKKDNIRKGGSVLVGVMIVLAVIIVTSAIAAFSYLGATEDSQSVMFCGVETTSRAA
jgi:Tfp pilus assembly major pilin PilA